MPETPTIQPNTEEEIYEQMALKGVYHFQDEKGKIVCIKVNDSETGKYSLEFLNDLSRRLLERRDAIRKIWEEEDPYAVEKGIWPQQIETLYSEINSHMRFIEQMFNLQYADRISPNWIEESINLLKQSIPHPGLYLDHYDAIRTKIASEIPYYVFDFRFKRVVKVDPVSGKIIK